jgi:hypothetical protein
MDYGACGYHHSQVPSVFPQALILHLQKPLSLYLGL